MIWREPTNHFDDFYFYVVKIFGYNSKSKHKISVPSAIIPEPHSDDLPQLVFDELSRNDVLQDSFNSLMSVHYERPKVEIRT